VPPDSRAPRAILSKLLGGLERQVHPGVGLWDPILGAPSPFDHYGHCAAALALRIAHAGRSAHWAVPLDAWMGQDDRMLGHAPFNRFLLLLLRQVVAEKGDDEASIAKIDAALARCRLARGYPSNNWSVLAQVTRVLEPGANRVRAMKRLHAMIDRWTTTKGGFIDFPRRPRGRIATPVAYHLKVMFIVSVVAVLREGDRPLGTVLKRLLDWALMFWDPAGYCGGLGRSNHSLFGDASLMATLVLLEGRPEFDDMAEALSRRLAGQFRDDDLLWLTPSGGESGVSAWDSYMFLSVYNAWAAAILAWATWHRAKASGPDSGLEVIRIGALNPPELDEEAGVFRLVYEGRSRRPILVSTKGQTPQLFALDEVELRYAGGFPFHGDAGDSSAFLPATRVPAEAIRAAPAIAGWIPVFESSGQIYGLTDFDDVEISRPHPFKWVIRMRGAPLALNRFRPSGIVGRLLAAADWRLFGSAIARSGALRRARLGVDCRVCWEFDLEQGYISREICIANLSALLVSYLNPGGCSRDASLESTAGLRVMVQRAQGGDAPVQVPREGPIRSALRNGRGSCGAIETLSKEDTRWTISWGVR